MPATTKSILIPADIIAQRIQQLAADIAHDYPEGEPIHLVCVLKGGFIFFSDLVRHLPGRVTLDFIALSSYAKGTTTSGEVRLMKDLDAALSGRHVIIVEDIVDTGITLSYLKEMLKARGPKSLKTACLLSKPSRRKVEVAVEYVGFTIDDHFVVGYGLDYAEQFRNLPDIAILDTSTI